jgi:hypothetical protein
MACILINDEVQSTLTMKDLEKSYSLYFFYRRETNNNFS